MNKRISNILVFIVILLFVFSFLNFTGTLTSGYHFQDDHEIIRINKDLQQQSFIKVLKNWMNVDLKIRFRPFYIIHRVAVTELFGSDFLMLSIYSGLLCSISLFMFFWAMRKLGFNILISSIFLVISFIGPQFAIWWRLGPNETIGVLMLSFAFFLMTFLKTHSYNNLINLLFSVFLILSSLSKESFLIIVPAMVLFKLWNDKVILGTSGTVTIRRNWILLLPLLIFILEVYYIINDVGLNRIGYAGIDSSIKNTISGIKTIVKGLWKPYIFILLISAILIIVYQLFTQNRFGSRKIWLPLVFSLMIVAPNLVLYAKSGMWERYYIPTSIGLSFLIVSVINLYSNNSRLVHVLVLVIVLVVYWPVYKQTYHTAQYFTNEGKKIKSLISAITDNNIKKCKHLITVDPVKHYEQSYSLKTYLEIEKNIKVYGYAIENTLDEKFSERLIKGWYSYFNVWQPDSSEVKPCEIIFMDKNLIESFFHEVPLNRSDFRDVLSNNNSYSVLIPK